MNSVYIREVMQRILDHWGVNQIIDVDRLHTIGPNIWRHLIATSNGTYELFSYPPNHYLNTIYVNYDPNKIYSPINF